MYRDKNYFNKTFKLFTFVAYYINAPNYNITLFLINIQAIYCLTKNKNLYMQ